MNFDCVLCLLLALRSRLHDRFFTIRDNNDKSSDFLLEISPSLTINRVRFVGQLLFKTGEPLLEEKSVMKSDSEDSDGASDSVLTKGDIDNNMAATVASLHREHMEYRNTANADAGESSDLSAELRRQSTGEIPYEDLPRALIATNIHEEVFTDAVKKKAFEDLFCAFGENVHFVYLPSFRRVRVGYETPEQVVRARIGMHQRQICGQAIKLFFLQPVRFNNSSAMLEPPEPTKQYLLSPPASPPVGWEPVKESEPVIDYDVLAALANLAPGQAHELHAADDDKPGIFVLPCEDPPSKGPKKKIQHTRRPEPT